VAKFADKRQIPGSEGLLGGSRAAPHDLCLDELAAPLDPAAAEPAVAFEELLELLEGLAALGAGAVGWNLLLLPPKPILGA